MTMPPHITDGMAVYERHLPELLAHAGQYVLVGDGQVVGVYETSQEAHVVGYALFKLRPFFVGVIELVPTVHHLGWFSMIG